jgi:hypothetical protein
MPAPGGAGYGAVERTAVQPADLVDHVTLLEVGKGAAVGHDVLEGLDVCVVDRGVVHVAEHATGDGEPDFGIGISRGAKAILSRQIEV